MRSVSAAAGVSLPSVEAIFRTKASLLRAAVDFAISGDTEPVPIVRREAVARMEATRSAPEMLALHAAHLRAINGRSARLAWAVEQAAASDAAVADLWRQMNENRHFAVGWAVRTLLAKPDHRRGLSAGDAEAAFWVALDWGTYRTLTDHAMLSPDRFEEWLRWYYRATLLDHEPTTQ